MKRAKKYAFGGFEDDGKDKSKEARKVDNIPDGYIEEPIDPAFPNRHYYKKESDITNTTNQSVSVRKPIVRPQSSKKISIPSNKRVPSTTTEHLLDRIYTETNPVVNTTPVKENSPVESFMGDIVVDGNNKAIGRLRNRSRQLSTGAGTVDTGQEAADFMYIQPDVKGAPVDSTRGRYALDTGALQDIFGTGRVMRKDVAGYKSKGVAKMATGGTAGAGDLISAGKPILDGLMSLLDGNLDYSIQPIVNASTIKNMATPYSKFALGGTVDDLSEDELYQLQQEADDEGITLEELLQQKQDKAEQEMVSSPEEEVSSEQNDLEDQYSEDDPTAEYAMGGKVPIEAEGGEVIEHPNGVIQKLNGPSHENGGIDINVNKGTKIYSDRLSIDGKTMQERKIRREKNLAKLQKLTVDNASIPLKNTIKRTTQIHDLEDQQDMAIQEAAKQIYDAPKEKAAYGGRYGEHTEDFDAPDYEVPLNIERVGINRTPIFNPVNLPASPTIGFKPNLVRPKSTTQPDESNLGIGDYVGLAGNLFNAVAPIINTNNAARATKPVINRFKGFGHDALDANQSAQNYVQTQQTNTNNDIDSSSNSQFVNNRNGARSVNTVRALDIATNVGRNKAKNNASNAFGSQMIQLLGQRGQLDNQRDAYEMQGQTAADTANAQNLDNYYTNLADNLTNFGTNVQGIGKSLNINRRNQDDEDMIGSMTANNIAMRRKKGRFKIVNNI